MDAGVEPGVDAGMDAGVDAGIESGVDAGMDAGPDAGVMPDAGAPLPVAAAPIFSPVGGLYTSAQSVTTSTTTPGATVHYTLDGTLPSRTSPVYAAPLSIGVTTTVRALAVAPGYGDSPVATAAYTLSIPQGTMNPVSFAPAAGEYNNAVSVSLTTASAPATLCYTVGGAMPTCTAGLCSGASSTFNPGSPIQLDAPPAGGSQVVKAIACSPGSTDSDVTEAAYTFRAAVPTASQAPGRVALGTVVTLTTATQSVGPSEVRLRFNTAASDPTCSSSDFSLVGPQADVALTRDTTLRVVACRPGYLPSAVATYAYAIPMSAPTLPGATAPINDLQVTVSADGAPPNRTVPAGTSGTFCYRVGGTPGCTSDGLCDADSTSTAPTLTTNAANTVGVRTCRPGFTPSDVATTTYTLTVAPVSVVGNGTNTVNGYTPNSGSRWWVSGGGNQVFTLQTATDGEFLRYATATGLPVPEAADVTCTQACAGDASCTECPAASVAAGTCTVTLPASSSLKAIGCKGDYVPSPLRALAYADPLGALVLDPLSPVTGTFNSNVNVLMATAPALYVNGVKDASMNVCFTKGVGGAAAPACDTATGACTTGTAYSETSVTSNGVTTTTSNVTVDATGTVVKAIACKAGVANPSSVRSATYTLKVATPTFSVAGTSLPLVSALSWGSATSGASTWYRRSDANLTAGTPACAAPSLNKSGITEFNATCGNDGAGSACTPQEEFTVIACKAGYLPSDVATQAYTASLGEPTLSPAGNPATAPNAYTNPQGVTLGHAVFGEGIAGSRVCYTRSDQGGGGTPTCNADATCGGTGTVLEATSTASLGNLSVDNTTVRAIACATGYPASSLVETTYNFSVDTYALTPAGVQAVPVAITFTNGGTANAVLCVSQDGTANPPDITDTCTAGGTVTCKTLAASETWTPLGTRSTDVTVKSRACLTGFKPTAQRTDAYTFTPYVRAITVDGSVDFSSAENLFAVGNAAGTAAASGTAEFYVSWDADNIYVGYRGSALASESNRFFHFYVNGAGSGTSTADNLPAAGTEFTTESLRFNAEWHFFLRTDGSGAQPALAVRQYANGAWSNPATVPVVSVAQDGPFVSGGSATATVEYGITRASLGLGTALRLQGMVNTGSTVHARFPASASGAQRYLSASMAAGAFPNATGNLLP